LNKYKFLDNLLNSIFNTSIINKLITGYLIDIFLIFVTCKVIANFILSDLLISNSITEITLIVSIFCLPIYYFLGYYRTVSRYINSSFCYRIFLINLSLISLVYIFNSVFKLLTFDGLDFWIIYWFLLSTFSCLVRIFLRDTLSYLNSLFDKSKPKVVIYGAGRTGVYLLRNIIYERRYDPLFFIDEDPKLWNRSINEIKIYSPNYLNKVYKDVDKVILAIDSLSQSKKKEIILSLKKYNLTLFEIPSFKEIMDGQFSLNSLKKLEIKDFLGRDSSLKVQKDLSKEFTNSVICISGGGGSIGSEISKQLIEFKPSKIILIERNEYALYSIEKKLNKINHEEIDIKFILGDVCSEKLLKKLFKDFKVDIFFHASAYKHVPIVEKNPLQSIYNNVFSTNIICHTAKEAGLKKVILISTDKAVRPTNIMGASKRVAEQIFQAYDEKILNLDKSKNNSKTIFSIVRFGNVLGSSGSVIPLFSEQIDNGGPITLTHKEIIRYFMTIEEAVNLVLNVAYIAKGGELFLLDMGKPVKILNLAKQMIIQRGLKVKDKYNPNGDIEIKITGLRPGEKLYEELLIRDQPQKTSNPLIFSAKESFIGSEMLFSNLEKLFSAIKDMDEIVALKVLSDLVPEWKRSSKN